VHWQELGTAAPQDIADVDVSTLTGFEGLVVGAPTWNTGAASERSGTGWDDVLGSISGACAPMPMPMPMHMHMTCLCPSGLPCLALYGI
jgi:hypothetical protein